MRQHPRFPIRALAAAAMIAIAMPAAAQLSSATVRGSVTADAKAQGGATVTATNVATGQVSRTTSRADGSYTLVGLAPGTYKVEITAPGFGTRTETLTVLVGQTVDLDLPLAKAGAVELQAVTVTGRSAATDRKTSEVGTNITPKQIEALPQNSRNFLAFADLAPGVRFDTDQSTGFVSLRGGAQNRDNINVFIDGVSQKNYILRGGLSGSDSTKGNNFPQSAIAEYKILSSNYKAEFDQVSSTAITAVTKSGTNELHGEVYFDRTGTNWIAKTPFEKAAEEKGIQRVSASQYQYGLALGGPIKTDVAHFFVAFDEKDLDNPRLVSIPSSKLVGADTSAGLFPSLLGLQGSFHNKFKEKLFFGKLDLQINADHRLEFTARYRDEHDPGYPEDPNLSSADNTKDRSSKESRLNLKHEWTGASFLNEANLGYEDARWNPHSFTSGPYLKYKVGPSGVLNGSTDLIFTGGSPDAQDRSQKALLIQDDFTYTGWLGHTVKTGAKLKDLKFDLSGTPRSVDIVETVIDPVTGIPYYDPTTGNCLSAMPAPTDTRDDTASCHILRAQSPASLQYKDKQFGIYLQDDWAVTKQLELNLGVRWDYETNMLNDDYVTPADRVAAFGQVDTRPGAAPGQTYAQSLAKGSINIGDYISTGSSRRAYKGAIQPRIGFSYDITGDRNTVVFGGVGRAYDRTIANHAIDEVRNNLTPGGEVWMIKNDHKMPYTDQFSLGLRQGLGSWNGEVGVMYARGHNQFNWFEGNRDPNGGWGTQSPIDPLWGGPPGFGNLILGDFITQTKTTSVYLKLDKPYTKSSGWGVAATYTYTDGKTTNREWTDDIFNFTYGKPGQDDYHPSTQVERHRLVGTGVIDGLLPWGLQLSGKVTLGSGLPFRIVDCTQGFDTSGGKVGCVTAKGEASTFRQVDLGIAKDVDFALGKFTFRADIINVFNTENFGTFDTWVGGAGTANSRGGDNANFGKPSAMSGPMRTLKLSLRYLF